MLLLSRVLIRWYRSFNTLSLDRVDTDQFKQATWNKIQNEDFPFISLDLDPKITTVVGANEAGKSHILTAISKAFRGTAPVGSGRVAAYDKQDMCRYCGFDHLEMNLWPQFVLEFQPNGPAGKEELKKLTGIADPPDRVWIRIDGSEETSFARIHSAVGNAPARNLSKTEWLASVGNTLPEVRIIAADKALASEVHVNQLVELYSDSSPAPAYDPMHLQTLADAFRSFKPAAGKAPDDNTVARFNDLCAKLDSAKIGPKEYGQLETLLFRDVLEVPKSSLEEIKSLASTNQPYIYRIVADIQRRIDERLDLSRVWQQDTDLRLVVEFEAGLFFFRITDKTGIKYSFDERSSGLKYFLSYYIQALALERVTVKHGMIVLMDEPDGFLSATGQRNLLNVFENLVDERRTRTRTQLIYTTHSPFLINKNFPHRVRLVRKGDGAEGTQVVDRSAYRRFEPIRTALGIDYADTLFLGSQNVVVEGPSDQRLLTAGVQRFGKQMPIDAFIDLNRVVFLTAGGCRRMKKVIARSLGGTDDKLPVVVALFDGDAAGAQAFQEIDAEQLLKKEYLLSLDQLGISNADVAQPRVLEDLVPVQLLAQATASYFKNRWNEDQDIADLSQKLKNSANGQDIAARMKIIWSDSRLEPKGVEQDEFRASVIEELTELLLDEKFGAESDLKGLQSNLEKVYSAISVALAQASAAQSRQTSKKRIQYFVREFKRSFVTKATKANVRNLLGVLRGECSGAGPELKQARDKIEALQGILDAEALEADKEVQRDEWVKRFETFATKPWG